MDILRHGLRYAARSLLSTPGFTATAVLTLALGIGANTAMFTIANAPLLRAPPFEHAGQLYWIYDTNEKQHFTLTDQLPPTTYHRSPRGDYYRAKDACEDRDGERGSPGLYRLVRTERQDGLGPERERYVDSKRRGLCIADDASSRRNATDWHVTTNARAICDIG
jgi:hypothetical protein